MQRIPRTCSLLALIAALGCQSKGEPSAARDIERQPTEIPKGTDAVGEAITYELGFADSQHHYISVRAIFPASPDSELDLSMAVWTPGSYLVREYARHIEELSVVSAEGTLLPIEKVSKNRWKVQTGKTEGIVAEYKLYCNELSVRTNFVDADSAVLNGAPTFLTLADSKARGHRVKLNLPEGWKKAVTGLDPVDETAANHFMAKTYDELVDSPIIAGRELAIGTFSIEEVPHRMVHLGDFSQWDLDETLEDVTRLTKATAKFWGTLPYEHYDYLNVILGGGGGLEHLDSTLMLSGSFSSRSEKSYKRWLGLVAHEFFHTWNVKRLRPASLGPFDYENENYTRSLWIAEGITSYYDDLLLRRSGLLDEDEYLERLGGQIKALQETPGRLVQSLSSASFDAWIKYYRHDENSINTSISYYTKGAVVAFLLDAQIRIGSEGKQSLDDLMRLLYRRYSGDHGYTPEQFVATANEVAGIDLNAFFEQTLHSSKELDYAPALDYFGLALSDAASVAAKEEKKGEDENKGKDKEDKPGGWIGLVMSGDTVKNVKRGTPAESAGFNAGDEVLAVEGYRLRGGLDSLLENFEPDKEVTLTISRRGRLRELKAVLAKKPDGLWALSEAPDQSGRQILRYRDWLAEYDDL